MASFDTTLGAYEIGVLVSYALFGVTTLQAYVYYSRFPQDPLRIKLFIAFIWCCEVAHAICIGHTLYQMTVSDYGHPERLFLIPRSLAASVLFSGIVGAGVQAFFASRIYGVSGSLYIPCVSWTLSSLRLLGSTMVCVYGFRMHTIPAFETRWSWLLSSLWSVASANDIIITATLAYWLYRQRPEADNRTLPIVDKLIQWTMETGVITSAAGLANLVCYTAMKDNFIWIGCFVVLARRESHLFRR